MHSTHFTYSCEIMDIKTTQITREETFLLPLHGLQLAARYLLSAISRRQNSICHGFCYASCRQLSGTRNTSMVLSRGINITISGRRRIFFYLTTHSTNFIYGYIVKNHSDSERRNSFELVAMDIFYALSHRQVSTYYTLVWLWLE